MAYLAHDKLTDKELDFCKKYMKCWNGAKAYRQSSYDGKNAGQNASDILARPIIRKYINDAIHKRIEYADINATFVLKELYECWNAQISDIIDSETQTYKKVEDWPPVWQKMCNGLIIEENEDESGKIQGKIVKVLTSKKEEFLKLIGKHINVQAFETKITINGKVELVDKIKNAQNRANNLRNELSGSNIVVEHVIDAQKIDDCDVTTANIEQN